MAHEGRRGNMGSNVERAHCEMHGSQNLCPHLRMSGFCTGASAAALPAPSPASSLPGESKGLDSQPSLPECSQGAAARLGPALLPPAQVNSS